MRIWMRTGIVFALVGAALAALSGCPGATATKEEEKTMVEEPPPPPPHVGTWRSQESWIDDDGEAWRADILLTFTKAGRAILVRAEYAGEQLMYQWAESHAWETKRASMIVKTGLWDHDDDYETPEVHLTPIDKTYYLVENDNVILMTPWGRNEPTTDIQRYERVADALPSPFGVWAIVDEGWTITISQDGFTAHLDRGDGAFWSISGQGVLDLDGYLINLTNLMSDNERRDPTPWRDGSGRAAFAPTPTGGIALSMPWNEDEMDEREYRENGNYWLIVHRKE